MNHEMRQSDRKPRRSPVYARDAFTHLPELSFLGFRKFHAAQKLEMHSHLGMMEITYLATGMLSWCVEHEQSAELHGGQVYCTWPGEHHGGVDGVWQPCEMYWLLLALPRVMPKGYLGLPDAEAQSLHRSLWRLPKRRFVGAPTLAGHFQRLLDLVDQGGPLDAVAARSALLGILLDTCRSSRNPDEPGVLSEPIVKAVELMQRYIERPLSLPAIAREVGLSTSHFSRRFKQETRSSPGDYSVHCRVNAARRMITQTDKPLNEIALRCGFRTRQYLATCFRRVTGRSPSSYRES